MALPKATVVTGGLEGHDARVEVGGGGLGALGLVYVYRAAARQRTVEHFPVCVGALCGGVGHGLAKLKAVSSEPAPNCQ